MTSKDLHPDDKLVKEINKCIRSGKSCDTYLVTDQRVLARITEGIYRQPASALRELIANAYDADAKVVSISTNAPRFGEIKVSDDGIGMTPEALANLVQHIGGSAKRTQRGPVLGMASLQDPTRSTQGRRLIGRIGIGLFSVAQLTRQFVIITKTTGTSYQLLAHVTLNFPDEAAELAKVDMAEEHSFQAGQARIWAERTPDTDGHGTTILLTALLPRVVHLLQSRDIWDSLAEEAETKGGRRRKPPLYHIGEIQPGNHEVLQREPCLPWPSDADERGRFEGLVGSVADAWQHGNPYARLEHAVDNYFQMIWTLGLSLPVGYVDKHPLSLTGKELRHVFKLPARRGPANAEALKLGAAESILDKLGLPPPEDSVEDFNVTIDGVLLERPIRFQGYPKTAQAHQEPVMFVGRAEPDLSKIPESQRAGRLAFVGYFFWTPRVVPQEHNGVLVRVNGASGTLFDPTFLKYQITERRLSQLMAEIYVEAGLESALNIDRESFNTAHPHYQVLASWVHNSLRLIRNSLKELQSAARRKKVEQSRKTGEVELVEAVNKLISDSTEYDPVDMPEVVFVEDEPSLADAISEGKLAYLRSEIVGDSGLGHDLPALQMDLLAGSVIRLFEAHGILQDLDRTSQAALIAGILKIFMLARKS